MSCVMLVLEVIWEDFKVKHQKRGTNNKSRPLPPSRRNSLLAPPECTYLYLRLKIGVMNDNRKYIKREDREMALTDCTFQKTYQVNRQVKYVTMMFIQIRGF